MEREAQSSGFRARAAQLLTWLTGMQQQGRQQHTMQTDRLVVDGLTRGMDDPDNRRQQGSRQDQQTDPAGMQGLSPRDRIARDHAIEEYGPEQARWLAEQQATRQSAAQERTPQDRRPTETLTAQVDALQQRLQAQQRAQQHSRSRGQGMGW